MADRPTETKTFHPLYTTWFVEYADKWKDDPRVTEPPRFSMEEFHTIFLEEADPTEYRPAQRCMGSWEEWQKLKRGWPEFKKLVAAWQEELEIKLRSDAMQRLTGLLKTGSDQTATSIAKFLVTIAYEPPEKRGRPSNKERDSIRKEALMKVAETNEEENRIMEVLQGGKR